jgi:hypothetical protein
VTITGTGIITSCSKVVASMLPGIVQSHVSSYSQPLAVPVALLPLLPIPPTAPGGGRLRSVVKTFIGFRERTSHTATMPSWDATANLEPEGEDAVQNEVGSGPNAVWLMYIGRRVEPGKVKVS